MLRVRTLFLSDVHLGVRECQAERLARLLAGCRADYLYLLGDIVDLQAMRRRVCWTSAQSAVLHMLLEQARAGVRVTFVPGNHDAPLRAYDGGSFGQVRVRREAVHHGADGARYLLLHGDRFDDLTRYHRWVAWAGDLGYRCLNRGSHALSAVRQALGREDHWSLAAAVKRRLPGAVNFVRDFEQSAARHAAQHGFDGVICGHIHVPAMKDVEGVRYRNCGDWVDSASALVELQDGRMELHVAPPLAAARRRRARLRAVAG